MKHEIVSVQAGHAQPGHAQPGHAQPGHAQPGHAQPGALPGALRTPGPRPRRLGWKLAGALGWLVVALAACIIEERSYDQQFADCWGYCDTLETSCTGLNRVYENRDTCIATCMVMDYDLADVASTTANTLTCRLDRISSQIESNECPLVGPGGNGACGRNCEALCALRAKLCADIAPGADDAPATDTAQCEADCAVLYDRNDMDASSEDLIGDTVQCRLLHVSRAALNPAEAARHCEASKIRPTPGESPETAPCSDPSNMDKGLECEKYCSIVMTACTDQFAVYRDKAQCLSACDRTMVSGERGDQDVDTIRCRRYHAYFSMPLPDRHCLHASATGDGHCGEARDNCTGYCRVLETACGERFATAFPGGGATVGGGAAACVQQCSALGGAGYDGFALPTPPLQRYAINPPPTGNNLMCRAYHAVEALSDPTTHCAAAFGEGECR
jgi:hypothetical protein